MRQELGRRPAFLRGEGRDSREEIVIGEFNRKSDEVRVHHAPVYHGDCRGSTRPHAPGTCAKQFVARDDSRARKPRHEARLRSNATVATTHTRVRLAREEGGSKTRWARKIIARRRFDALPTRGAGAFGCDFLP
jgi:hypothetical protein